MEVEGIILILSCIKYKDTRLKKFKLSKKEYLNWKVIYVIGNEDLDKEYEIKDDNFLYIKCEDTYIHLLKKLVLSIKYVNEIFKIKQGILRCGDDLIFNEENLIKFLKSEKKDYAGTKINKRIDYLPRSKLQLKRNKVDKFMFHYYKDRKKDLDKIKNLTLKDLENKYSKVPVPRLVAIGTIFYISNLSCKILVDHMEKINYNIFHFDDFSNSYPNTIEDIAIAYIMFLNDIPYSNFNFFYSDDYSDYNNKIAIHTNEFK